MQLGNYKILPLNIRNSWTVIFNVGKMDLEKERFRIQNQWIWGKQVTT